jgi:hypothetical protein
MLNCFEDKMDFHDLPISLSFYGLYIKERIREVEVQIRFDRNAKLLGTLIRAPVTNATIIRRSWGSSDSIVFDYTLNDRG